MISIVVDSFSLRHWHVNKGEMGRDTLRELLHVNIFSFFRSSVHLLALRAKTHDKKIIEREDVAH